MSRWLIEVDSKRISGPRADPSCSEDLIAELVDGQTIYPQDPDKDDETEVELSVVSIRLVS